MARQRTLKPAAVHWMDVDKSPLPSLRSFEAGDAFTLVVKTAGVRCGLALIERLKKDRITVTINSEKIAAAPKEKVTDEIRKELAIVKPFLLEFHRWQESK